MALDFKDYAIAFILGGLFLFAMISAGVQMGEDNDVESPLLQNKFVNDSYKELQTELTGSQDTSEGQISAFEQDVGEERADSLLFGSIKNSLKVFRRTSKNVFQLTFGMLFVFLKTSPAVMATLIGIILMTFIFLGWKLLRTGK